MYTLESGENTSQEVPAESLVLTIKKMKMSVIQLKHVISKGEKKKKKLVLARCVQVRYFFLKLYILVS